MPQKIVVFGASGAIGKALVVDALSRFPTHHVIAVSRNEVDFLDPQANGGIEEITGFDLENEEAIGRTCWDILKDGAPDFVIVATGMLHGGNVSPERRLQDLDLDALTRVVAVNFTGPSLILKHLLPNLPRGSAIKMGVLSARVGSISDNQLGGWYSYRCSKAALNMMIKSASIELSRRCKDAVLVGLYPGTVASDLSAPFQQSVPEGRLFSPQRSAGHLLDVLTSRLPEQSGLCFDWAGEEILP